MKAISVLIAITLFVVNFYLAFSIGVAVGMAQTHTVETIILPPQDSHSIPRAPDTPPKSKEQTYPMSYTFSKEDEECLALNIYFEARDQDLKGKLAIGLVTMKRVESKYYPDTVCDVVWQKNKDKRTGKHVAQFSWTLDGKSDVPKNQKAWERAQILASSFTGDGAHFEDVTNGAHLYHADYVSPYWKKHYDQVAQIGSHLFYK